MDWGEIWRAIQEWLEPVIDWAGHNPIYALIAILTTIGEFIGLVVAAFSLRRSRRTEREERAFKEEQIKLNREISNKLSRYEELFGDLDISRQLKQLCAEREARIAKADRTLGQLNLSIEERERIKAQREDDLKQLEEEKKAFLAQKEEDVRQIEERLKQVVATAQNEALRETIKKRLQVLERELSEIEALKQEYTITDEDLDLPKDVKDNLKQSLRELVPQKQEILPQPYVLQIFFLTLLVFLLPYPIDTLVLLISAVPVFMFVIDAIKYLKDERLNWVLRKGYKPLVFLTLYALWVSVLSWLMNILAPFIDQAYEYIYRVLGTPQDPPLVTGLTDDLGVGLYSAYSAMLLALIRLAKFGLDVAPYVLPVLLSAVNYFRIRKPISEKIERTLTTTEIHKD